MSFRTWATRLRRTPLHPQWLLGRRRPPAGIDSARGTVLDIGASDRWILPHLPPGVHYVALDYPATVTEFYSGRPDVFADACRLPISDESVDAVICLEVIEHVADPVRAVCEIGRVLRPGGTAWLSMPFLYPLHNQPYDFQRYTEYGLRRDAQNAGLEVIDVARQCDSIRNAGLLMCLAIAGGVESSSWPVRVLLLPIAALAIVATNLGCLVLSRTWPDWPHMTVGHTLRLRKRDQAFVPSDLTPVNARSTEHNGTACASSS